MLTIVHFGDLWVSKDNVSFFQQFFPTGTNELNEKCLK